MCGLGYCKDPKYGEGTVLDWVENWYDDFYIVIDPQLMSNLCIKIIDTVLARCRRGLWWGIFQVPLKKSTLPNYDVLVLHFPLTLVYLQERQAKNRSPKKG